MIEKNDLVQIINNLFFPLGFKRKGNNWIHKGEILTKTITFKNLFSQIVTI